MNSDLLNSDLIPAIAGAIIAGIFLMLGAWHKEATEHEQWLRQERLNVYAQLLAIIDRALTESPPPPELFQELHIAVSRGRLITDTAWTEIVAISSELIAYASADAIADQATKDKVFHRLIRSLTDLERKARKELGNRPIDWSEIPYFPRLTPDSETDPETPQPPR